MIGEVTRTVAIVAGKVTRTVRFFLLVLSLIDVEWYQ